MAESKARRAERLAIAAQDRREDAAEERREVKALVALEPPPIPVVGVKPVVVDAIHELLDAIDAAFLEGATESHWYRIRDAAAAVRAA